MKNKIIFIVILSLLFYLFINRNYCESFGGKGMKKSFKKIKKTTSKAAKSTTKTISKAATTTAKTISKAATSTAKTISKAATSVGILPKRKEKPKKKISMNTLKNFHCNSFKFTQNDGLYCSDIEHDQNYTINDFSCKNYKLTQDGGFYCYKINQ